MTRRRKINKKVLIVIIVILLSNKSMANYISINKFNKRVNIAKPIINFENDEILLINKNSKENYYYFSITNFNGNNINEIKVKYNLELQLKNYDCLKIKLYKNGELMQLNNNMLFNNEMKITKQKDNYIIQITYDESLNIYKEDIKQTIKIIVYIEQA